MSCHDLQDYYNYLRFWRVKARPLQDAEVMCTPNFIHFIPPGVVLINTTILCFTNQNCYFRYLLNYMFLFCFAF